MTIKETSKGQLLTNAAAQTPVATPSIDAGNATFGSFQLNWTNLTAAVAINGTLTIETSDDNVNWTAKSGATLSVTTASGTGEINLNTVIAEAFVRAHWTVSDVTGGTLNLFYALKG